MWKLDTWIPDTLAVSCAQELYLSYGTDDLLRQQLTNLQKNTSNLNTQKRGKF